jgi:hypothetical protein
VEGKTDVRTISIVRELAKKEGETETESRRKRSIA